MRTLTVISMTTLDGVMQAPGSPEEDPSDGFTYGGWVAPYSDEQSGNLMQRLMRPADLLLGRKTFEIWENYWPSNANKWPGINEMNKYVLSTTRDQSDWLNTIFLNSLAEIQNLKATEGADIKVWGSSELIQLLLANNLVDEHWLIIYPLTLGTGKKLFTNGPIPAAFTLVETASTPKGVLFAHYKRAGTIVTGTVGA